MSTAVSMRSYNIARTGVNIEEKVLTPQLSAAICYVSCSVSFLTTTRASKPSRCTYPGSR